MEEAGVIQNLFSSCDRGMTLHASILGKKFTALLGLDPGGGTVGRVNLGLTRVQPRCNPNATPMEPQCNPNGTPMQPPWHRHAIPKPSAWHFLQDLTRCYKVGIHSLYIEYLYCPTTVPPTVPPHCLYRGIDTLSIGNANLHFTSESAIPPGPGAGTAPKDCQVPRSPPPSLGGSLLSHNFPEYPYARGSPA